MSSERRALIAKAGVWMLMLSASLLNFLNFNDYPLFRPEVGIVLLGFALISVVLTGLEKSAPRLAFVFTGLMIGLAADLNVDAPLAPLLAGGFALAIARSHNAAVVKVAGAAFGTVVAFQLVTGALASPPAARDAPPVERVSKRPPVIHLMLDSYVGLDGMSADADFVGLRKETEALYRKARFRVYESAYSRHANTANSVPYFLSFGTSAPVLLSQQSARATPERFDYFDRLAGEGYAINVRGANFIDLCTGQAVTDCRQYPYAGLEALTRFPMTTTDRAKTLAISLAGMSSLAAGIYNQTALVASRLGVRDLMVMRNLVKTSTPKAALTLIDLQRELSHPQYGQVYFAHLLLPHEPYVFDADCRVKPHAEWHTESQGASRAERNADYQAQVRCMHSLLGRLFDTLDRSASGRAAVVIVQGDHGSRIVTARPTHEEPDVSLHDYAMTYSAMFAIRAPGIAPGIAEGRASLDELLKDFAAGGFASAPPADVRPAEVVLASKDWIPKRRVPLPDYQLD